MRAKTPALWSGTASVCLDFFFSPAFASLLEAWNWHRLGNRPEKTKSLLFGISYVVLLLATFLIPVRGRGNNLAFDFALAVGLYFAWFVVRGRFHATMVSTATAGEFRARSIWLGIGLGVVFTICFFGVLSYPEEWIASKVES